MIVAMGVISLLVIASMAIFAISMNSTKVSNHDLRETEALNVAQAGIDSAIETTLVDFNTMFPGGSFSSWMATSQDPDGPPVFDAEQILTDSGSNEVGRYQVYAQEDPDGGGDLIFTAKGSAHGSPSSPNASVSTIRVTVKYKPSLPPAFDYALILGDKLHQPAQMQMQANGRKSNFTGKIQINANQMQGQDENFASRHGYADTVGYTGVIQCQCGGDAKYVKTPGPDFPAIDLTAFNNDSNPKNVFTETLPSSGVPSGGWTRSGSTFTISASNFQNKYKDYNIVQLISKTNGATVNISGSGTITSSVLVPGISGTGVNISYLKFTGPNLILQPNNGLAILTTEGIVDFINNVQVGSEGHGALVYMSSQNAGGSGDALQFELQGNMTVFGSVLYQTQVKQGQFQSNGTGDMSVIYDGSFKDNPDLPDAWISTGGSMTAVKLNYSQSYG